MAPRSHDYASRGGGGVVTGLRRRCGALGCQEFSSPSLFFPFLSQTEAPSNHLSPTLAAFLWLAAAGSPPVPLPHTLFPRGFSRCRPSAINRCPPERLHRPARAFRSAKGRDSSAAFFGIPDLLPLLVVSLPLELASLARRQVRVQSSSPFYTPPCGFSVNLSDPISQKFLYYYFVAGMIRSPPLVAQERSHNVASLFPRNSCFSCPLFLGIILASSASAP